MSDEHDRVVPIPHVWRAAVCAILRTGDNSRIMAVSTANRDWNEECPDSWLYQRHQAMENALQTEGITGRHILDMTPPCDTYEFWFHFESRKFLGKIGLLPDGKLIIIFSSHRPRKGEERL
jgi:hypothetical protein